MLTNMQLWRLALANLRKEHVMTVSDILSTGASLAGLVILLVILFKLKKYLRRLARQPERSS